MEAVDIVSLVTAVCEEFSAKAAGRKQTINFQDGDGRDKARGLTVQGDRRRLRQVFAILLDNALRYSPDGGEIEVRASADRELLQVTVKDRGIGLSEEEASHAFERFFRGREAQSHAEQGSGLGLPVARA